jgi:hypothetical protein
MTELLFPPRQTYGRRYAEPRLPRAHNGAQGQGGRRWPPEANVPTEPSPYGEAILGAMQAWINLWRP